MVGRIYLASCLALALVLSGPWAFAEATYTASADAAAEAIAPTVDKVVVYKKKRRMHLMLGDKIVRDYRISLGDNPVGPKLYEGDKRTPEGEYILDWRKPSNNYRKSIHISYPNEEDRKKAAEWGERPGGNVMIHGLPTGAGELAFAFIGLDWTKGCIAVSDEEIDEIWDMVPDGTPISIHP